MPRYKVTVPLKASDVFVVQAKDEEEAKEKIANGEYDYIHEETFRKYDPDTNNWEVQQIKEVVP